MIYLLGIILFMQGLILWWAFGTYKAAMRYVVKSEQDDQEQSDMNVLKAIETLEKRYTKKKDTDV